MLNEQNINQGHVNIKKLNIILILSALALLNIAVADDSAGNKVAAEIKYNLIRSIRYNYDGGSGFCDVMVKMDHKNAYATVKRVSTTGDGKLCRFIKTRLKKGSKYRYDHPEKLIHIHISHAE
ncbi:hypothetical protein Q6U62_000270 [Vibrio parahaemolyticus]|uniref:hypothetical protein n=1 Tax=Vibrio parahaemolyticus TaxID=670 RepID=UPI001B817D43|nr:hypothetical protein [Vibrio parahaemolyticus]EJC1076383.1 hypothetical protein [Vibrio parahaemolyticus]EJK2180901.1 hypothetical protein [Vibrio parahaemolyticus]ELA7768399.1 hypothetical protein [Vibrio parahaemolyticus]MDF4982014.1 hypothetical protein [Vibrio parahaemolyticus]HAV1401775.1 hypothetical protein [Vibrio parahaemolyticus]